MKLGKVRRLKINHKDANEDLKMPNKNGKNSTKRDV